MVRICIFAAITAVVLVFSFGCGQQGAGNSPSGSTEHATTSPTESLEPPTTTEETIIAGEESTQATETTEETTAFQAPEGTPTSSTARIVCLRADQGASPPTKSTEAVNRGVFTRVLTPKVAARPDGVHYRIDNRLGKATTYTSDPTRQPFVEIPIPKGVSHRAELFPPGLGEFQCDPIRYVSAYETTRAHFEIVEGHSGYKSLELECKPGAEPRFSSFIASGADSKFELVSYRDPLEEAREYYNKGLKESDVVEAAGYPKDPNPTVRVVRKRKVIATVWFSTMEMYATYCSGQI